MDDADQPDDAARLIAASRGPCQRRGRPAGVDQGGADGGEGPLPYDSAGGPVGHHGPLGVGETALAGDPGELGELRLDRSRAIQGETVERTD